MLCRDLVSSWLTTNILSLDTLLVSDYPESALHNSLQATSRAPRRRLFLLFYLSPVRWIIYQRKTLGSSTGTVRLMSWLRIFWNYQTSALVSWGRGRSGLVKPTKTKRQNVTLSRQQWIKKASQSNKSQSNVQWRNEGDRGGRASQKKSYLMEPQPLYREWSLKHSPVVEDGTIKIECSRINRPLAKLVSRGNFHDNSVLNKWK